MHKFLIKFALLLTLIVCALGAVSAQIKSSSNVIGVGLVTGIESAAASCEMTVAMCFGNTYVLNSFGEWESHH